MRKKQPGSIPTMLRRVLDKELRSHIDAHMDAHHFPHIQKARSASVKAKGARRTGKYALAAKLPIFSASCGSLARHGLHEPQRSGWILLVHSAVGLVAQVEVQERQGEYAVSRVSTGTLAEGLKRAVERARKSAGSGRAKAPQVKALSIPAMHVLAVWAHWPTAVEKDILIPVTTNFTGLSPQRVYTRRKVDRLLRQHAINMILRWYDNVLRRA